MVLQSILDGVHRLRADERGAVAVIMGVLMIPLVGALAIGFEVSNWYMVTRSMQNAADAATIAAATNAGANYGIEGKAVAARYGFVDGTNNVSVAVTNTAACPGGGNTCYSATISGYVPLLLSRVLGITGDGNVNGTLQKRLSALAVAKPATTPEPICMLALASSGAAQGIRTNGSPVANMNGCNVMSNTAAKCDGSNLNAGWYGSRNQHQLWRYTGIECSGGDGPLHRQGEPYSPSQLQRLWRNLPARNEAWQYGESADHTRGGGFNFESECFDWRSCHQFEFERRQ